MIGVDIIEIKRIEAASRRYPRILERLFTRRELELASKLPNPGAFYAGRFAAKEAVAKALQSPLGWHEVEILADAGGAPVVKLAGRAQRILSGSGYAGLSVSISHSREHAVAVALVQHGS